MAKLNYSICIGKDIRSIHSHHLPSKFWHGISDQDLDALNHLLKNPIWQFQTDANFSKDTIEEFVNSTNTNGYLLLDYKWQAHLGDFAFDPDLIPEPKNLMVKLLKKGIRIVLTLTPFIKTESPNFAIASKLGLLVRQGRSESTNQLLDTPALTSYKVRTVYYKVMNKVRNQFASSSRTFFSWQQIWEHKALLTTLRFSLRDT